MSGGHFDYNQMRIKYIADEIEEIIERERKRPDKIFFKSYSVHESFREGSYRIPFFGKTREACVSWIEACAYVVKKGENAWVDTHSGYTYEVNEFDSWKWADGSESYEYHDFSDKTLEKFEDALSVLRRAYVYAERIDMLLCGDDGEDDFVERLKEDLEELER